VTVAKPVTVRALVLSYLVSQRRRITAAVVAGVLTIAASVGLMSTSAYLIERASQRPPILSLEIAIVSVRFFGIARGVFRYLERMLSHDSGFRVLGELRAGIYARLIPLTPAGLGEEATAELFDRIVADVDTVQEWFVRGFAPLCTSVIAGALVVVGATLLEPAAGATLLVALLLAASALVVVTRGPRLSAEELELRGAETAAMVEYIQGLADLTALGEVDRFSVGIDDLATRRQARTASRARRLAAATAIQAALPGLLATAIVTVCISGVATGLNPLTVGVLCLGSMAAAECVAGLPAAVDAWSRGIGAVRRLASMVSHSDPAPISNVKQPTTSPDPLAASEVSFRYGGSGTLTLRDVSLEVKGGECVVITGPSGNGKSTLASLFLRFAAPSSGSVRLGGADLLTIPEESLRASVGALTQDAHLFAGSIRDNILLACPSASDVELREVLARAHLDEWVDSLPQLCNTQVGELGSQVSGGERRRIALARSLLAGFRFLVADEPTEGLDERLARAVLQSLCEDRGDCGLILITHRPDICPPGAACFEMSAGQLHTRHEASILTAAV
jgi:thiol reductant ABC exporter CydC subunit